MVRCTMVLASEHYRPVLWPCNTFSRPVPDAAGCAFHSRRNGVKVHAFAPSNTRAISDAKTVTRHTKHEWRTVFTVLSARPAQILVNARKLFCCRFHVRADCGLLSLKTHTCWHAALTVFPSGNSVKRDCGKGCVQSKRMTRLYCRAVRRLSGRAVEKLVRHGLMSSPPRRV